MVFKKENLVFKIALERIPEGIIILNEDQKIIFFNERAEELMNLKEEFLGKNFFDLRKIEALGPIFRIFERGIFEVLETQIKLKEDLVLKLSVFQLKVSQEKIGYLIYFTDITREVSLERLKREFVAIAAHQLRTPISATQWGIERLLEGKVGTFNEKQKKYLQEVLNTHRNLLGIIDDLLNTVKIEEGRVLEKLRLFPFEAVLDYVLSLFKSEIKKKEIELEVKKPLSANLATKMDVEKIKLALENLLDNALKYTLRGGKIFISFEETKSGREILFSIRDTGIGIPENEKDRIFSKFFRAKNAAKIEPGGSGLGLYLVKNIIEAHGGKVWFESKEGKGTTFYFTLPIIT